MRAALHQMLALLRGAWTPRHTSKDSAGLAAPPPTGSDDSRTGHRTTYGDPCSAPPLLQATAQCEDDDAKKDVWR